MWDPLTWITIGILATAPAPVEDLAISLIRRPLLTERWTHPYGEAPRLEVGIVAVLSTTRDLRSMARSYGGEAQVNLVRCAGRKHIKETVIRLGVVESGALRDAAGDLERDGDDSGEALPRGKRRAYRLPIAMVTAPSTHWYGDRDYVMTTYADHDLRRDREDLCLFVATGMMFVGPIWRTNTVIIPHAAVRATLSSHR